jgi:hypothetical protein
MQKRDVQAQRVAEVCSVLRDQLAAAQRNCARVVVKLEEMAMALHTAVDTRAAALRSRIQAISAAETAKLQQQLQLCEQVLSAGAT